jgi:hypothetical protein
MLLTTIAPLASEVAERRVKHWRRRFLDNRSCPGREKSCRSGISKNLERSSLSLSNT